MTSLTYPTGNLTVFVGVTFGENTKCCELLRALVRGQTAEVQLSDITRPSWQTNRRFIGMNSTSRYCRHPFERISGRQRMGCRGAGSRRSGLQRRCVPELSANDGPFLYWDIDEGIGIPVRQCLQVDLRRGEAAGIVVRLPEHAQARKVFR